MQVYHLKVIYRFAGNIPYLYLMVGEVYLLDDQMADFLQCRDN